MTPAEGREALGDGTERGLNPYASGGKSVWSPKESDGVCQSGLRRGDSAPGQRRFLAIPLALCVRAAYARFSAAAFVECEVEMSAHSTDERQS
jgi:hypothetical protein